MLASAAITGLIVAGTRFGANSIDPHHIHSMWMFTGMSMYNAKKEGRNRVSSL